MVSPRGSNQPTKIAHLKLAARSLGIEKIIAKLRALGKQNGIFI